MKGREEMKKFLGGYLVGTAVTAGLVMGLVYGIKKTVIAPIEAKENELEANRRKAARKSYAR